MPEPQVSLPEGYRLASHDDIDSTNDEALRLAEHGEPGDIWIQASRQTLGRGRAGHRWHSIEGNLFTSLLVYPECPAQKLPELGFVAGIAVHGAVTALLPESNTFALELKWPNDLLLNGKKVSGLLLESRLGTRRGHATVIGFGLNVNCHPDGMPLAATSLKAEGVSATCARALEALADHFAKWRQTWNHGEGFATVRKAWLERSIPVGSPISVHVANERLEGRFSGIADDGALLLQREGKPEKRVTAGDVFPL